MTVTQFPSGVSARCTATSSDTCWWKHMFFSWLLPLSICASISQNGIDGGSAATRAVKLLSPSSIHGLSSKCVRRNCVETTLAASSSSWSRLPNCESESERSWNFDDMAFANPGDAEYNWAADEASAAPSVWVPYTLPQMPFGVGIRPGSYPEAAFNQNW